MTAITEFRTTEINGYRVTLSAKGAYLGNGNATCRSYFVEVRIPGIRKPQRFNCRDLEIANTFYLIALQKVRLHVVG